VDLTGRLYVASRVGLQFCDQAGRVNGIISSPEPGWMSHATFGGPTLDTLFVLSGSHVFRRSSKTHGVISAEAPVKPPAPKL
jgi:gluconolactonase